MPLSESMLARLAYQHQTIAELTKGFSEDQLKKRVHPDKWSIFENISHLCAYQPLFLKRIRLMIETDTPVFERYVAESDEHFYECLKLSVPGAISKIDKERDIIIEKLKSLNGIQLNRSGRHPTYGLFNITTWTDFFLLHEAHHLWAILQLIFSIS
ncbi:MAG: DinB family protein [Bacteroidetes bacterium]|nr:DinB family protein [Bacteroidota bacterium]MBS1972964.1 DinB family protein [Bacteroidota bacterium]